MKENDKPGGGGGGKDNKAENEKRLNTAATYGWNLALLNSDPELKRTFRQAVKQGWTPQRFIAEVQDTKWFQKHSASWRQAQVEKTVDPTTWKAKLDSNKKALQDVAAKMGAVLSPAQLQKITNNITILGWNESQVNDALANYVNYSNSGPLKGQYIGDAGRNAQALRETARANGYQISDKDLGKWNKAIARGDQTVEDYQAFMRRQAALMFPSFATELDAGTDMIDIANPYIKSMANILEINPEQIDLQDRTIRKALASKNQKTGKPEAMAIYDFEDSLRQDSRWLYTDNAHEQVMGSARNLLRNFGLSA